MTPSLRHSRLFEPLRLRSGIPVRNSIAMAPMTTWSGNPDETVSDEELRYLRARSAGVGIVMTAACHVIPHGKAFPGQWGCHSDALLPSLEAACRVIHEGGALAVLQLHHGGRMSNSALLGRTPLSASAVPAMREDAETPRAMTEEEIVETIDAFAAATLRAIRAGYDGVEIHGANTYLLQQFFSPHSNRRTDAWGGNLEARMRFPLAVLDAVRKAAHTAGRPFAVGYRLSPEEIEEPGITMDDTLALVEALVARDPDWIHVSTRNYMSGSIRDRGDHRRPTARIAAHVAGRVLVIGVGLAYHPADTAVMFEDGCGMVALGRALLMDPDWVRKVREGREEEILASLPAEGGDVERVLPARMYRRLLEVKGWIPVS